MERMKEIRMQCFVTVSRICALPPTRVFWFHQSWRRKKTGGGKAMRPRIPTGRLARFVCDFRWICHSKSKSAQVVIGMRFVIFIGNFPRLGVRSKSWDLIDLMVRIAAGQCSETFQLGAAVSSPTVFGRCKCLADFRIVFLCYYYHYDIIITTFVFTSSISISIIIIIVL
jgi:hypothetical protein